MDACATTSHVVEGNRRGTSSGARNTGSLMGQPTTGRSVRDARQCRGDEWHQDHASTHYLDLAALGRSLAVPLRLNTCRRAPRWCRWWA